MPHIHTSPDQHDMTVSMYIIRRERDEWKCLVHMHRKLGFLMQIGGHIELNETPWQTVVHELHEESGYLTNELSVLQPTNPVIIPGAITHPTAFMINTHTAGKGPHYHSDLCYGFEAYEAPMHGTAEGESDDLRWMTVQEMESAETGRVLDDVLHIYKNLIDLQASMIRIPASNFSLEKPVNHFHFE